MTYYDQELKATLNFYANPSNWIKKITYPDSNEDIYVLSGVSINDDGGWRARRVIKLEHDLSEFKDLP